MLVFGALFVGSYLLAIADGVPAFDAKQTCRGTEAAGIFPGRNLDSCVRSEQAALDQLRKRWPEFPPRRQGRMRKPRPDQRAPELCRTHHLSRDAAGRKEDSRQFARYAGAHRSDRLAAQEALTDRRLRSSREDFPAIGVSLTGRHFNVAAPRDFGAHAGQGRSTKVSLRERRPRFVAPASAKLQAKSHAERI